MAFLKTTHIDGNLLVTGSENYISASEFRGVLAGTASYAAEASKVTGSLTLQLTGEDGTAVPDIVFNGETDKTFSVDLSDLETKEHVSASVADLQDQISSIVSGSITGSFVSTEDFNSFTASQAEVDSSQSARLDALETASADYVAKSGDTMAGDLDMASNSIKFGDIRMVWNTESQEIEFIVDE